MNQDSNEVAVVGYTWLLVHHGFFWICLVVFHAWLSEIQHVLFIRLQPGRCWIMNCKGLGLWVCLLPFNLGMDSTPQKKDLFMVEEFSTETLGIESRGWYALCLRKVALLERGLVQGPSDSGTVAQVVRCLFALGVNIAGGWRWSHRLADHYAQAFPFGFFGQRPLNLQYASWLPVDDWW